MKKQVVFVLALVLLLSLAQCVNKEKGKLVGIWQLETMNIDGTKMDGQSLGNWLWEFNEEGGYLANIGGDSEKGWYKLKDKQLTLKITTKENRTEQVYVVNKLDSSTLELASTGGSNKATLRFMKWKEKIGEEKD